MEIASIYNINAPLAVSSVIHTATLPQSVQETDQRNESENAAVKLNLSPAAKNILSSQHDVSGTKPVPESERQEGNPSSNSDEQSRYDSEGRKGYRR